MTLDKFLDRLEQTPRRWYVFQATGRIRNSKEQCPIEAVFHFPAGTYDDWAGTTGLDDELAIQRVSDTDDQYTSELGKLRSEIMKRCGL